MSAYATAQDILDRYAHVGVLLSRLTEEGEPDTAPLQSALAEAGSEIDAALRGRYALPLNTIPPILKRIAVDIAVDAIPRDGGEYAELFKERAKTARQLLKDIANGVYALDLPGPDSGTAGTSGGVKFSAPCSHFRRIIERM